MYYIIIYIMIVVMIKRGRTKSDPREDVGLGALHAGALFFSLPPVSVRRFPSFSDPAP